MSYQKIEAKLEAPNFGNLNPRKPKSSSVRRCLTNWPACFATLIIRANCDQAAGSIRHGYAASSASSRTPLREALKVLATGRSGRV